MRVRLYIITIIIIMSLTTVLKQIQGYMVLLIFYPEIA